MRTGRPRKPTALKILQGTARRDRMNVDEPKLAPAPIAPPRGMTGRAKQEWIRLCALLVTAGVITVGDTSTFESYCRLVAEVETYEKLIKRVGVESAHQLGYANYLLKLR